MKKILKILVLGVIYLISFSIFNSDLDKILYLIFLMSIYSVTLKYPFSRTPYLIAILLIAGTGLLYLLDPLQVRLVHYIYKPATWTFYYILVGVMGELFSKSE